MAWTIFSPVGDHTRGNGDREWRVFDRAELSISRLKM